MTSKRGIFITALAASFLLAQGAPDAEDQKITEIMIKRGRKEALTPEETEFQKNYLAKVGREFQKLGTPGESTGLTPLTELGTGAYKGEEGGLYPGGGNVPPPGHLKAGLALAKQIAPLDADGRKSADGKIVLVSLGMSNTTMEFQVFQKLAAEAAGLNPKLAIVDGAQGGQTAIVTADPQSNFWKVVEQRLEQAGVTAKQVQVVWMLGANAAPWRPFPVEAKKLAESHLGTLQVARERFPNLKIAYLSSRNYAGYATTPLNPEPHAYETAFSVKWLIARQISGDPALNYRPDKGAVRCPWIAWGPYLWADGTKGRKDGLVYVRNDFAKDGTHPTMSGREKVAKLLLEFFKTDPTARPWFARP